MKKREIIILALIVVLGAAALYMLFPSNQESMQPASQNATPKQIANVSTSTANGRIPVNLLAGEMNVINHPIVNISTGATVSFAPNTNNQTVNEGWIVSLNGKKIGPVTGQTIALASFSPDNKYLAFRVSYNIVQENIGYNLVFINLTNGIISSIAAQPQGAFIESYAWNGDDTLNVTSYPVSYSIAGSKVEYYRTSPKQVWQYNLVSGSSTLISTIP